MSVSKIFGYLDIINKIPTSLVLAFTIAVWLCLFLPDSIAGYISVLEFRNSYRIYLGPTLLISVSVLGAKIYNSIVAIIYNKGEIKAIKFHLNNLTPEEQGYLLYYIAKNRNTLYMRPTDGIIQGLEAKNIVYMASTLVDMRQGAAYNLQTWARKYLRRHPELLADAIIE